MNPITTDMHVHDEKLIKVQLEQFTGFYVLNISSIRFFIDSPQDTVNFKNKLLWAFENPKVIG